MVQQRPVAPLYIDDAPPPAQSARAIFLAYIERAARALPTQRPDAQLEMLDNQHDFYQRHARNAEWQATTLIQADTPRPATAQQPPKQLAA